MTDTTQEIPASTPPQPTVRRRRMWLLAVGSTALVLLALGVGILIFRGNDASSTGTSQQVASAQLASVQQSCQQWSANSAPTSGNGSTGTAWCTAMTGWMGQQLHNGVKTGAMMWGSATTLETTCQQWMAGSGSAGGGTASPAWCGQMAKWMTQHMGSWGNWMTNGNMMGN